MFAQKIENNFRPKKNAACADCPQPENNCQLDSPHIVFCNKAKQIQNSRQWCCGHIRNTTPQNQGHLIGSMAVHFVQAV